MRMNIEFNTSESARKMLYSLQIGRLPYAFRISPMLFGKDFYESYLLYQKITDHYGAPNKLFEKVIEKSPTSSESSESDSLNDLLQKIEFPLIPEDDPFFKKMKKGILSEFRMHDKELATYFMKVFGFHIPRRLVIILAENHLPYASSGRALPSRHSDTSLAGYLIGRKSTGAHRHSSAVLIHEMVHSSLFNHKIINEKESDSGMFVEAVIDYFVPNGMLAHKLGLVERLTIDGFHRRNVRDRPESKSMSERLLPAMKEYEKNFGKQTIWDFLSENGFDKYMIQSSAFRTKN
jgi:hypothetical protein